MTALALAQTALAALDLDATPARVYAMADNAVREAEMAEYAARGEQMWCGLHPDDDAFWAQQAEYGVKTARDLVKRDLSATFSDWYKELHGIRPRWVKTSDMTIAELEALIEGLAEEQEEANKEFMAWSMDTQGGQDEVEETPAPLEPWEQWEAKAEAQGF